MKQFVNIYIDAKHQCPRNPSWVLAKTADEALSLLETHRGQVKIMSLDDSISEGVLIPELLKRGLSAELIYLHGRESAHKTRTIGALFQAMGNGSLPSSTTVYGSRMPNYNEETGEFIKPE
jgi:hypothetical protein